jgi:hypothetical protein
LLDQADVSWIAEYDIFATSINSDEEVKLSLSYKAIIANDTKEVIPIAPTAVQLRDISRCNF